MVGFEIKKSDLPERVYNTGAHRDNRKGKGRFDLLSPIFLFRLARHMEAGAERYEARNWEKGIPLSCYLDPALRHIVRYMAGERDEDHLTAAAWNLHCFIHTEQLIKDGRLPPELDDGNYLNPPTPARLLGVQTINRIEQDTAEKQLPPTATSVGALRAGDMVGYDPAKRAYRKFCL